MPKPFFLFFIVFILVSGVLRAQHVADSILESLQQIPTKYLAVIDKKATVYTSCITNKTVKTLTKLSRWENKIKTMLQKVSPATAAQLFASGQTTFTTLLQQVQQGEAMALTYRAQYNKYTDDVTTSLKYITQQKEQLDSSILKKAAASHKKMKELASEEDKSEALQQFIKERKKQLVSQAISHIGPSKYLVKMNKEAFYYAETLKNYKEIFSDSKKAEETVKGILNKIPAFKQFMERNSILSQENQVDLLSTANVTGLQTRGGVQNLILQRISAGGPNAQQVIRQNLIAGQDEISKMKDKLNSLISGNGGKTGGSEASELEFTPNMQKTKTFFQRLEYGFNLQFNRSNDLIPAGINCSVTAGYKITDRSLVGVGLSYVAGFGNIQRVQISHQGIGLRSFINSKLKKEFYITGGYEWNFNPAITEIRTPNREAYKKWSTAALLGITKKLSIKTKLVKGTTLQFLYDFLHNQHLPVSQPFVFRVGYILN